MENNPSCSKSEFREIVNLFTDSIESELQKNPGIKINISRVIQEFENNLIDNLQILPDLTDDKTNTEIKEKIESMQTKALQLKSQIHEYRTCFIENVRLHIENELEGRRPQIEQIEEDENEAEDLNNDQNLVELLDLLDSNIEQTQKKVTDVKAAMESSLLKYGEFEKEISQSLKALSKL